MKHRCESLEDAEQFVAPHVGAWIETQKRVYERKRPAVAPHVGAWIETKEVNGISVRLYVAPHVGAWIETCALL